LTLQDEPQTFSSAPGLRVSALSVRRQPAPELLPWEKARQLQQLVAAIVQ
jgi:hypothetical protein